MTIPNMNPNEPSSVSEYLIEVNKALSEHPGRIKGEVTEVKPYPKTIYFSIKDPVTNAVLKCMIYMFQYRRNGVELKAGEEVIISGVPNIYEQSGGFSFKTETIEVAGEGALKREFERLKAQLSEEGLLDPGRKRMLPALPSKIGIITSMRGVVIQDFSSHLSHHGLKVSTLDTRVEGKDAIHDLLASIRQMSKQDIEVLVIIRGGGSLESMQAFNTESVVRAIADFKVPTITGIGHDVDVTLSQLVADAGESTPTAAARRLSEPWKALEHTVNDLERQTVGQFRVWKNDAANEVERVSVNIVNRFRMHLHKMERGQVSETRQLLGHFKLLSNRVSSANNLVYRALAIYKSNLKEVHSTVKQSTSDAMGGLTDALLARNNYVNGLVWGVAQAEQNMISNYRTRLTPIGAILLGQEARAIKNTHRLLSPLEDNIHANDPNRNMKLGYSLTTNAAGRLIRSTLDIDIGAEVNTKLPDGSIKSIVRKVER